jgi:hypothetical protein
MIQTSVTLKPFRAFVTGKYYENRDEYDSAGQVQPYTFNEYLEQNISLLMDEYRRRRKVDADCT